MKKVDVLNLEWTSYPSRDRETATLVCNYLRYMGFNVVEGPVHNGYKLLNFYKPKLFYITNTVGASINVEVMKYAKSLGIWCVSGVSEGNFRKERLDQYMWSKNKDRILYEDKWMLWTQRARELVLEKDPTLQTKLEVVGGAGFDRYKILTRDTAWFDKYCSIDVDFIVGVGCWNFGFTDPRDPRHKHYSRILNQKQMDFFKSDRDYFNIELCKLIEANPRIVFLLKEHPGSKLGHWASGIEGCDKYLNVHIVKNEVSIFQCLSVSNIWLSYQSTTAMEAWLMGTKTGLLNPSGTNFPLRTNVHHGQPNFPDAVAWSEAIKKFQNTGKLPGFEELQSKRALITRDVIEWDDALNHVRAGNVIIKLLESEVQPSKFPKTPDVKRPSWKRRMRQRLMWQFCPYMRNHSGFNQYYELYRRTWSDEELREFSSARMHQQLQYYKTRQLTREQLRKIKAI